MELIVGASAPRVTLLQLGTAASALMLSTTHASYSDTVAVHVEGIDVSHVVVTPLATHWEKLPEQVARNSASEAAVSTIDCR